MKSCARHIPCGACGVAIFGGIFAFLGRQAGKVLNVVFGWATIALFGRVPKEKQPYVSAMAAGAVVWPIDLIGLAVPSLGTFLLAFVTLPRWADPFVRPVILVVAIALPLAVGFVSTRLVDPAPKGSALVRRVLRGYLYTPALFIVFLWMAILAPLSHLRALAKRWQAEHIPFAVKPDRYDSVVDDLVDALARARIAARAVPASWVWTVPGRVLAVAAGRDITSLVPEHPVVLKGDRFDLTVHPMDLALRGAKAQLAHARSAITRELTFTDAYQTWTKEAQQLEDGLRAASERRRPIDDVRRKITNAVLERDEWEVLYRLLLQVELHLAAPERERRTGGQAAVEVGIAARVKDTIDAVAARVRAPQAEPKAVELFIAHLEHGTVHFVRREMAVPDGGSAADAARSLAQRELHERGTGLRATGSRSAEGRRILTYCLVSDQLDVERAQHVDLGELERLMRNGTPTDHPTELEVLWRSLREVGIAA